MASAWPRICSGRVISGRDTTLRIMMGAVVANTTKSAPPSAAEMVVLPAPWSTSTSPAMSAATPSVPLGKLPISMSSPSRAK